MKDIYQSILENAKNRILKSNDAELFSENFEKKTYASFAIETPKLNKQLTTVKIDKEIMGFHNAPSGVSFSPGSPMNYAQIEIPIEGDMDLFGNIVGNQFYNGSNRYVKGRTFYYKEFSSQEIAGNENLIEEIKNRAKISVNSVETGLESFKNNADKFNETELTSIISQITASERERRNTKSSSEDKLNPFA